MFVQVLFDLAEKKYGTDYITWHQNTVLLLFSIYVFYFMFLP